MASWVGLMFFLFGPVSEVTQCPVGASVSVLGVKPLRVLRVLHYMRRLKRLLGGGLLSSWSLQNRGVCLLGECPVGW